MSTSIGSLAGAVSDFAGPRDRQRDAGGLEAEPRREVDDPFRAVAFGAQQHVDAIRDQVVVGVAERALVRVERREIEGLLRAAARPARRGLRRGGSAAAALGKSMVTAVRIRVRAAVTCSDAHVRVRQRALRVARAGRLELIQRDHRFDEVAAVGHLQRDRDAIDAVRGAGAGIDRGRGRRRSGHALSREKLPSHRRQSCRSSGSCDPRHTAGGRRASAPRRRCRLRPRRAPRPRSCRRDGTRPTAPSPAFSPAPPIASSVAPEPARDFAPTKIVVPSPG